MSRSLGLKLCRAASVVAVLVPCLGFGFLAAAQGVSNPGSLDLDGVFHLALAGTLLGLAACFVALIVRAASALGVLAYGLAGFLAATSGALLSELFGPAALVIFGFATGVLFVWTVASSWAAWGASHARAQADSAA